MKMNLTISGSEGSLLWVYSQAASLRSWTVTPNESGQLVLSASIASVDSYRSSQRPLVFVVRRPHVTWRWPVVSELQIVDGALSAYLGPMEQ
jgi:hypothetical protein